MKKLIITRTEKPEVKDLSEDELSAVKAEQKKAKKEIDDNRYVIERNALRGSIEKQLEFIAENGIEAFYLREQKIREEVPKPNQTKVNVFKSK